LSSTQRSPSTSTIDDAANRPASATPLIKLDRIRGLDGIRAISVLLVLGGHYGFGKIVPGGLGVTIFFFVSGFLITTLLLREIEQSGTIDLRNFYIRRFLRLTPELFAFVAIVGLFAATQGFTIRPLEVLAALFYFTNYYHLIVGMCGYDTCAGWHILWSLAVEEHFYLVFPLFLLLTGSRPKPLLLWLSAILVLGFVWRTVVVLYLNLPPDWTYKASDARLDSIAYGCWLAVVFARFPKLLDGVRAVRWPVLIAAVGILAISLVIRDPLFRETVRYSLQGVAIIAFFIALYAGFSAGQGATMLETTPMVWLGRLSYGAYLWHFVPLDATLSLLGARHPEQLPLALRLCVALGATTMTFGLAWLSYTFIAVPFTRLRHHFAPRRMRAQPSDASVETSPTGIPRTAE
jgi:peptidoglycan/LPS O-acetylase OafA/YrhL